MQISVLVKVLKFLVRISYPCRNLIAVIKQIFFVPFESEYAELQRDIKNHSLGEFVSLGNENTTY